MSEVVPEPIAPAAPLEQLDEPAGGAEGGDLALLLDVPVELAVEIGRTTMTIRETLAIAPGSVIALDRLAGEPVDLLANGRLGDIVFFGAFLLWAVFDFRAARRRSRPAVAAPTVTGTALTVVIGLVAYYLFAFHLHTWVTGVPVM